MANNPINSLLGPNSDDSSGRGAMDNLENKMLTGRVTDISLNTNSTMWESAGQWAGIGTIKFQLWDSNVSLTSQNNDSTFNTAKPLFPQLKNYPLCNELVLLFRLPNTSESQISGKLSYYYLNVIGLWNSQHHNAYPDMFSPNSGDEQPSQMKDYQQIEAGDVRKSSPSASVLDFNGESGGDFVERSNIHPILPFAGDNIFESRFGSSIRLGSTSVTSGNIKNNWSSTGKSGDPITILRNGQPTSSSVEGWIPLTEDINTDKSSIYLTSTQQIPINVAVENKEDGEASTIPFSNTIVNIPISPKAYNGNQVILNSGRILFNTTSDSILMSSKQSIVLESVRDLAIKSQLNNINILAPSGIISLGKQNASESVILGDKFALQFENLLGTLKNVMKALAKEPKIPAAGAVARLSIPIIEDIVNLIPSMKSKKVKTS
tara:strand:+ start:27 stop:1328 length:1302 start_codon:yes stop_codon:yes gene_type:complete